MKNHEKARAWRKRRELTIEQLATLTGYGPRAIMWMESGLSPPNQGRKEPGPIAKAVWHRYKMLCAAADTQLQTGKKFDW